MRGWYAGAYAVGVTSERVDYPGEGLAEGALASTPLAQVRRWLDAATQRQAATGDVPEPACLAVATVDAGGAPNVRAVLLRFLDENGIGFVTNTRSTKSVEIAANPAVAATLTWPAMFRAIRFRGIAEPLPRDQIEAYFRERPWGSRISAWASQQSAPVADRAELEASYERYAGQFPERGRPDDVPVPEFWGGYLIRCREVEFWAGRSNRLHDRLVFSSLNEGPANLDHSGSWRVSRRQP
ncbi:MAG: pyridoxamine 5'-phosphate oxidase [Dermatophilaceae bacterium]